MYYYVIIKFLKVDCIEKKFIYCNVFNNYRFFRGEKIFIVKEIFNSYFLLNLDIE